jgi:hypothetical protein
VSIADEILPLYDVSDEVAVTVEAEPRVAWDALLDADLLLVGRKHPVVAVLGGLRMLPELLVHLIHGETPPDVPTSMRLRDMGRLPRAQGGWIALGERPGEEIALGLVGKFWRPVIEYANVDAEGFTPFAEPGYAKTVYQLAVRPAPGGKTQVSALMRTATTDEHARRWFRRYWTLGVGAGAHVLANALLDSVREDAERRAEGPPT